jgi:mannosyltransferase OCH1-like enzyme
MAAVLEGDMSRSLSNTPKKLHLIWVGNANRCPAKCIQSWRDNHPDWRFKLWTDKDMRETDWINAVQLRSFAEAGHWSAVADLMRYEILYREGGVHADADSFSVRPLEDWFLRCEMFACWENTLAQGRARLVSNAFLGSVPGNPFLRYLIDTIGKRKNQFQRWSWSRMRYVRMGAWKSVGPYRLTKCIYDYNEGKGYHGISILPSHMFCPNHYRGKLYSGHGLVYADHQWASTRKVYDELSKETVAMPVPAALDVAPLPQLHVA